MESMDSAIESVVIYRQGALVTRVVELELGKKDVPGGLRLVNLPLCMDDATLRTQVEVLTGKGSVVAAGHRVELNFQRPPQPPPETEQRLEALALEQRKVQYRLDCCRRDLSETSRILGVPDLPQRNGDEAPNFSIKARRELIKLRQGELARLGEQAQELEDRLLELNAETVELTRLIHAANTPAEEQLTKAIAVTLEGSVEKKVKVRIQASYEVPGVRWAPSYTLRFDKELSLVEMLMRASIAQATGEDWSGVKLKVSTSDPTSWKDLPELPSRRIGRQQPSPPKAGWRPPPLGTDGLFADYDRGPGKAPPEAEFKELPPPPPAPPPPPSEELFDDALFCELEAEADLFDEGSGEALFGGDAGLFDAPMAAAAPPPPPAGALRQGLMMRSAAPMDKPSLGGLKKRKAESKPMLERRRRDFTVAAEPPGSGGGGGWEPDFWGGDLWSTQLEVGSEHLDYALLRMPGPDEFGRGKLKSQDVVDACLRMWKERGEEVGFEPRRVIARAFERARAVGRQHPPGDHTFPSSVDGFDFLYHGEVPVDVPCDGKFHSVPLATQTLSAQKHLVCVPRETLEVFRRAEVESLPDLALPAGPADVLVDGDYLLTTQIHNVVPGGTLKLGLGVEQSVKVVRNTHFEESTSGMMGGKLHLAHDLSVEVANHTGGEVRLEVRERIPETEKDQKEVQVEVESVEPPWEKMPDTEHEHYRWSFRLGAGESRELKARFVVHLSAKLELAGGNRRS